MALSTSPRGAAVVVMAKVPRPGQVKTRLRPLLTDAECADLSTCFLLDTFAKVDRLPAHVIVAFAPADGRSDLEEILHGHRCYVRQQGSDLGERLISVMQAAEEIGFGPLVFIGTDSPTLPLAWIESALGHVTLNDNGIAIGPTEDGGYYLLAMSRSHPELFCDIPWSTDRVYQLTVNKADRIPAVSILELPLWYDVDEPHDLIRMDTEFQKDQKLRDRAPETYRWITAHPAYFQDRSLEELPDPRG